MKDFMSVCMLGLVIIALSGANGCKSGDILSSSSNTDNSTDNSQHGISSCSNGSTFVCDSAGPGQFVQSEQCKNVNGDVVTLQGPNPIDSNLVDACAAPESADVQVVTVPVE